MVRETDDLADDEQMTCAARAAARLARQVEMSLADAGLTMPQYRLLAHLSRGSSWPSPVAKQLGTSLPSVTALVDGAVAKGLVERRTDDDDRRRVFLSVTDLGREALAAGDRAAGERLSQLASFLDPDDAERAFAGLELWGLALDREAGRAPTTSA